MRQVMIFFLSFLGENNWDQKEASILGFLQLEQECLHHTKVGIENLLATNNKLNWPWKIKHLVIVPYFINPFTIVAFRKVK